MTKQKYQLLSNEFLEKYKSYNPLKTQLGMFTYVRTYSQYLPDEKRREYWFETVARAVDYNVSLGNGTVKEAEMLFDNVFNLRQFLSGRTLWAGGGTVSKNYPMSNYNCAFGVIDDLDIFHEIFYLLLVGSGVGFRATPEDVEKLPRFRTEIQVNHKYYEPVHAFLRREYTGIVSEYDEIDIVVGDSKEGWTQALKIFLEVFTNSSYKKANHINFIYNNVRPKGERLKTFGGFASGHESLHLMFVKLTAIIKKMESGKATTTDIIDMLNIIGEGVVSGGVRRTAEIALIDVTDKTSMQMKNNIYTLVNGEWVINESIIHRQMSNNSIYYHSKPTREFLHWQIQQMRFSGEPAWVNSEAGSKRRNYFNGVNPCFTGDMKLLTVNGYKTFSELNNTEPFVVNVNGDISKGKVWYTGDKEIVKVTFSDGVVIECTPNHVFRLVDGSECEAKDLKGKRVNKFVEQLDNHLTSYVKYGFIQGDGQLTRLSSTTHKGLELNIGKNDFDIINLFGLESIVDSRNYYVNGYNEILTELGFDSRKLPERTFPSTFDYWSDIKQLSFLKGMYSANGSVIKNARVSYKTTSKELRDKLIETLNKFGIDNYYTTNKGKVVSFSNGDYLCKESYDINITRIESVYKFAKLIGFVHEYKIKKLIELINTKGNVVIKVDATGEVKAVYDFHEPLTHWGVVNGYVAHNCGEILLDSRGMCNLTEVNVMAFVIDGKLDYGKLFEAQSLSVRAGMRMTLPEFELHKWDVINKRDRLIGASLTGWQDMVNATSMSVEEQSELLKLLRETAHNTAEVYAVQLGINEPLLKTTIKPSGTLSLLPSVSAGIHYSHSEYYIRRVRISYNDPLAKAMIEMGYNWNPEVGQDVSSMNTIVIDFPVKAPDGITKSDVSAIQQLENYKMFMRDYVDHNVSITVHVRDNEWEEVEQWAWDNWDDIVAVSFIPYNDSFYKLMPYEEITKEQYDELLSTTPNFDYSVLSKHEDGAEFELGESCDTGICPIR